jgi:hypothetical protein
MDITQDTSVEDNTYVRHSTPRPSSFKRKQPDSTSPEQHPSTTRVRRFTNTFLGTTRSDELSSLSFYGFSQSDIKSPSKSDLSFSTAVSDPSTSDETIRFINESYNTHILNEISTTAKERSNIKRPNRTSCPDLTLSNNMDNPPSTSKGGPETTSRLDIQAEIINAFRDKQFHDIVQSSVNNAIEAKLKPVESRLTDHTNQIAKLSDYIEHLNIKSRANNLIFAGIPETEVNRDDLKVRILEITKFVHVELTDHDITDFYRLRKNVSDGKPRPVLVSFLNKGARDMIYFNRLSLRLFKPAKVFISEDLTPLASELFFLTRQRCKELNLFSCHTMKGSVFVKPTKNSNNIKIFSKEEVLLKLPDSLRNL